MEKLKKLRKEVDNALKEKEIVVDDIYTTKQGKYTILTIVLDRVGDFDLDTIVMATNLINPIVDEIDPIDEEYILDVISKERGNENG